MPPTTPLEPGTHADEQDVQQRDAPPASSADFQTSIPSEASDAPVTFVPHTASGAVSSGPVRIRTGRYGELEEHELIRLLDTIEDERAKGRFRESIYISLFFWLVVAWFVFYGPRVLWHVPKLISPMDVLRERQMTQLNMPILPRVPKLAPAPKLDEKTLDRLRTMTRERVQPAPAAPPPPPPTVMPAPANAAPNLPLPSAPQPQPRPAPPVLADAPTPQPSSRPSFNSSNGTAGDAIRNAVNGAAHDRSGSGYDVPRAPHSPLNMGGAEILSDTMGVNFNPYLQRILRDIKRNWDPLIPEEAKPPLMKQGETYITFTILPDGNIGGMHLDGSTHDDAINRSCWSAITSEGQFPPLPSQFHGPNLQLRIHFLVNKELQ